MSGGGDFWAGYWKSLKPREVEEPVDVWVHRPLGYLLARALLATPVSPNLVTCFSIVLGTLAGAAVFAHIPRHLLLAGGLLFASTVFDCADGQLARLRGKSSPFGRMLDGVADLIVSIIVVFASAWLLVNRFAEPRWLMLLVAALALLTIVTSSFHTAMYDHYKNVFLRLTHPTYRDSEDYETALARFREQKTTRSLAWRLAWMIYLFYVKSQRDYVRKFDPFTPTRFTVLPEFSAANAALYRRDAESLMRIWRTWFGFGSLMFGLAVSIAFELTPYYLGYRLFCLNALFYGYMRPKQRRASERALRELTGSPVPAAAS
jgi:phosphatidylglycerophosphate synthase